tara:strand:- start:38 stop:334 length:297 start_codon:yes stop_codon:yes gene_type:complete
MTEEETTNVTVHYNVGPGHKEYDANGHISFAWDELRGRRMRSLKKVDIYQGVLLYNSLSTTQQTELAEYRQALLNLPNDYDTPEEAHTNFPTKPSWMT